MEDAISNAVNLASKNYGKVNWFELMETRGHVSDGKVMHYQCTVKIGYVE